MNSNEITGHFDGLTKVANALTDAFVETPEITNKVESINPLANIFVEYPMAETTCFLIGAVVVAGLVQKIFFPSRTY